MFSPLLTPSSCSYYEPSPLFQPQKLEFLLLLSRIFYGLFAWLVSSYFANWLKYHLLQEAWLPYLQIPLMSFRTHHRLPPVSYGFVHLLPVSHLESKPHGVRDPMRDPSPCWHVTTAKERAWCRRNTSSIPFACVSI